MIQLVLAHTMMSTLAVIVLQSKRFGPTLCCCTKTASTLASHIVCIFLMMPLFPVPKPHRIQLPLLNPLKLHYISILPYSFGTTGTNPSNISCNIFSQATISIIVS